MKKECNLVIGSTGLIGSSVCKKIKNKKNLFTISLRQNNPIKSKQHYKIDVKNFNKINKIISGLKLKYKKINVFFLAGESSVENSILNSQSSINNSIIAFHNVVLSLLDFNSTIILASSGSVYDSRNKTSFSEIDPLRPPSPYAAIKYASEGLAMSYNETFGMDIRIARIFSVFGEQMKRFFIYDLVKKLNNSNEYIQLKGSGNQERDYLHVEDVASGLFYILKNGSKGEVYNLCSGRPVKLRKLAETIKHMLKKDEIKIIWDKKDTKGIRDCWYGKNEKIKKIGFKCQKSFHIRLNSTIKYISSNF